MGKQKKNIPYEIVNGRDYIWKTPKKIETVETPTGLCPHCAASLIDSFTLVSVENNNKAKIPGLECRKCGVLFVSRSKAIRSIIQDNVYAKDMTLNGDFLWNFSDIRKQEEQRKRCLKILNKKLEILSKINGSIMLVMLKSEDETLDCVITSCQESQQCPNVQVVHYSSLFAREIITSIYHSSKIIRINGKDFKVVRPYYPSDKQVFPFELMPSEMRIKSGGGYSTSSKSNFDEVIDVLLYSPFTERYEIAHATYNHAERECFMDISIFRNFVKDYGNPGLKLTFGESASYGMSFDEMRAESILHAYGYSASESDGFKETDRHELLSEIVDLELLSVQYIVHMLEFFIRTHTSDKYYLARDKWERDIKYISNYNINTKRFLIVRYRR